MNVSLKLLWGRMVFLKKKFSRNYLLLISKSIEKSPIENQWLVNVWTEGNTESISLLRAKWGGTLLQWLPKPFPHQAWDMTILPCFMNHLFSLFSFKYGMNTPFPLLVFIYLVPASTKDNSWTIWVISKDNRYSDDGFYQLLMDL